MRMRTAVLGLTAALIAGAACSDNGDDGASPTTAPEERAEPDPTLVAVNELLDDEGALSVEAAQRIFATAVAPLPGVEPLDFEIPSGSGAAGMAIRRLAAALDELPPEVAAAVTAIVEPEVEDGSEEEAEVPRGGDVPTSDELAADIAAIRTDFDGRTGHTLGLAVRVRAVPDAATGGDAVTTSTAGGACRIALPRSLFGDEDAWVRSTLAHELWHCYQLDANAVAFDSGPEWVLEGQAEWAGEAYVGGSGSSASEWNTWLLTPNQSLFRRSYDAIGVYAVAEAEGADPWQTMLPMLGQANQAAVETLFGAAPTESVLAVAQALVRAPEVGAEWEHTGPGITGAQGAPVLAVTPDDAAETSMSVGRYATLPVVLAIRAGDVLTVTTSGGAAAAVGFQDHGTFPLGAGGSAQFCLKDGGCECPDGSNPGGGEPLPQIGPGEGAAAVAAVDAGELSVSARLNTLEDACENRLAGTWTSDVGTVLSILTAPYGGGGPSCSGPYLLNFGTDYSFSAGFSAVCSIGEESGTARADFAGTYIDTGTHFTVVGITGSGSITVQGRTFPLPVVDGLRDGLSVPTPYTITGDVLRFTFRSPDGNTFTLEFTRSG